MDHLTICEMDRWFRSFVGICHHVQSGDPGRRVWPRQWEVTYLIMSVKLHGELPMSIPCKTFWFKNKRLLGWFLGSANPKQRFIYSVLNRVEI
jgi:hypothetical protein